MTVRADDKEFKVTVRIDTPKEQRYFRHGGILQFVLRELLAASLAMAIPELLETLLTAAGPSGHEDRPHAPGERAARDFAAEVGGDHVGSSLARVPGTASGPTLAVVGHIDEIGLHVSHIDDEGYLRFGQVGGWDPIVLVGQRVRVITRDGQIPGVIGRKPIHLLKDDDRKKVPELKELHIDIGAADGDEARELVRIGDVAVIDADPIELPRGRVVSRALDNRVGCYVAAEAARLVAEDGGAPGDVVALAVAQEETVVRRLADQRVRAGARCGDRGRFDVRHRPARDRARRRSPSTRLAPGR